VGENQVFGPDTLEEADKQVKMIQERLRAQKVYANRRGHDLAFQKCDVVYLKVSPPRRMCRFGLKGKLAPRYIEPFTSTTRRGEVAYELALPEKSSKVHNMFHVSQIKKCFDKPEEEARKTSWDAIEVQDDLTYEEYPVKILDEQLRTMRRNVIKFCKVQWNNHSEDKATWEREDALHEEFPNLFS